MRTMPYFAKWLLGLAPPQSGTKPSERQCVVKYARGCKRLAEIGVWHGVTTRLMLEAMDPGGVLLAVDPYRPGRFGFSTQRIIARRHLSGFPRQRICWLRMTGAAAAAAPQTVSLGGIQFVFIDGDHSYEGLCSDWEAWNPLVVPGGHLALHDSCSSSTRNLEHLGSVHYARDVICKDPRFEVAEVVETLTVLRRREAAS